MAKRIRLVCTAAALVPLALLAAACSSSSSTPAASKTTPAAAAANASGKSISETGSTLLFPLFGTWQTAYSTANTSVTITSGATGSGTGIADASEGLVNIGASDAYLSASDLEKYPGLLNIPLAVASIQVFYNLPNIKSVNLNGTVLAQIYTGKITTWNDPAIAKLNPGVSLPSMKIVTVHRADSSGSTFLFTSYLSAQDPSAWPSSNVGTTITWPSAPGALAETGSGGMVTGCGSTKGCIAYIGVSYDAKTAAAGLGSAALANKAGKFVQDTPASVGAALASFPAAPSSGAEALINSSAATGYPIINYEYAIVKKTQPSAAEAKAVTAFLSWILTTGDSAKNLGTVGFVALPSATLSTAQSLVSSIGS
ncbi:MAG: phosphate ABC transporter substrate-binding protein PstS [Streptosporangiaceae bacterium]